LRGVGSLKTTFEKILLVVEASDESLRAARVAIDLAQDIGAMIIAIYVVDVAVVNHLASFSGKSVEEVTIELEENGWKYLYNVEEEAVAKKVKIAVDLEEGHPADKIIELTKRFGVDLLVYGRIKEAGARGVKAAKSTEQFITHVDCPILIV